MTFEPVLPPLLLAVAAGALIALRLVALRAAAGAGRRSVLRWSTTTAAMLLILLAAARPVSGAAEDTEPGRPAQTGANVYFVVDRSADSALTDPDGRQRMAQMRDDIGELVAAHPGARFALISFASRPAIDWPLSDDAWSLQPLVETLTPYAGPTADSTTVNAAAAANVLRYQLIAAGQQYPSAPNLVYYLGSGAPESTVPQGEFEAPPVDGGAVLGYGSGRGEATLRAIADQLGVPFVSRATGGPLPVDTAAADAADAAREPADAPTRVEFYWLCTMLAGLLLLVEIYLTARDLLRARATRREVLS
ncbi:VWA domain-containing protein [Mycobacterium sp. ITM-2016-00317]|uniref:VWA domain-containing protein n=1 Tax=Mycobacterium sp. ITM-2016-00317 TaxID=2099694 RepID=UPI00287FE6A1|nr:VWA domain-containing protein [Mycobacterium sp. ITM-2016-00317]WNG88385.1 VWA domain-containing protein [Mycobacterium sp. ITM-2016-00317]